jgi:predicted glycosyltransferase
MWTMMIDTDRTDGGAAEGLAAAPLRTLLYCHDTYGLGHLRRTLSLAGTLSTSPLAGAQLIVSGSPAGHRFPLPPGTDLVSLPWSRSLLTTTSPARCPSGMPASARCDES